MESSTVTCSSHRRLHQLASFVQHHKWRDGVLLWLELSRTPAEMQQAIAAINAYHHHLGELISLRHEHSDLLKGHPEDLHRIDLAIDRTLGVVQCCERILKRCSLVEVDRDGLALRMLRWKLKDKRSFTRHRTEAERNDVAVGAYIAELRHLASTAPAQQPQSEGQIPSDTTGGEESGELLVFTAVSEKKEETSCATD